MIPIILNHDMEKIVGNCDEKGFIQFNIDIDFEIYKLVPSICFKSEKQTGKVLEKGKVGKMQCLSLIFRRDIS